jgi:hypothetical protein
MEKAKKIVNSWWFKAALAGGAAAVLAIYGNWLLCGVSIGIGVSELLKALMPSKDCKGNCEKCSPDCACKK